MELMILKKQGSFHLFVNEEDVFKGETWDECKDEIERYK